MEAQLSRKAALIKQTPYWRWLKLIERDNYSVFEKEWIDGLVKSYSLDNLSEEQKEIFYLCKLSQEIAEQKQLNPENFEDLQQIIQELEKVENQKQRSLS